MLQSLQHPHYRCLSVTPGSYLDSALCLNSLVLISLAQVVPNPLLKKDVESLIFHSFPCETDYHFFSHFLSYETKNPIFSSVCLPCSCVLCVLLQSLALVEKKCMNGLNWVSAFNCSSTTTYFCLLIKACLSPNGYMWSEQVFSAISVKALKYFLLDCYKYRNVPGLGCWLMLPELVQYLL